MSPAASSAPVRSAPAASPGHVGLAVRELGRSIAFYCQAFALTLMGEGQSHGIRYAFLGDGARVTVTLWEQPTPPGLHHLAFETPSADDLREAEVRLARLGATMTYEGIVLHGDGATSGGLYFTDPDGLRLEIYAASGVIGQAPVGGAPTCGFF